MATIVKDAHAFSRERMIDLTRLNEAERRVLGMLGEGHTAKSIANALGTTSAAVNERLREARRKTGVGSSRELARLLKAQENRHDRIGVGNQSPLTSDPAPVSGNLAASDWKGPIAMTLALITVLAAAAVALQQPNSVASSSSNTANSDPLFANIFAEHDAAKIFTSEAKSEKDVDKALAGEGFRAALRQLHGKVHSEPRDPAWANPTENSLRAAFASIPRIGVEGTELRVRCGSSLCEIAGTADVPPETGGDAARDEFNRATMSRLNPHALKAESDKLKLESIVASIATMSEEPPRLSYVFYYSRTK